MEYSNPNTGLLSSEMVKNGDRVKIIDEARSRESNNNIFWNVKVELPDGSHKLAGVMGSTGDEFAKAWGSDTLQWVGKIAMVEIRQSKAGKEYVLLWPTEDTEIEPEPEKKTINPDDLPF